MSTLTQTSAPTFEPKKLAQRLLATDGSTVPAIARITLGAVMLPHGLQKAFGMFGGYGFEGTMGFFTETVGLPWILGFLAIVAESAGALALIVGAASRLAAFGIGSVMLGAVVTSHLPHGFFMNWSGAQAGEGFEFHILAIGLAAIVMVAGAGRASIDRRLAARLDG